MPVWVPRALIVLGAVALVSAIVSISVGNGGPGAPALVGGVNDVQRILGGIRQDGAYLGPARRPGDDHGLQRHPVRAVRRVRDRDRRPPGRGVRAHAATRGSSSATSRWHPTTPPWRRSPPRPPASRTASGSTWTRSCATSTSSPAARSTRNSSREVAEAVPQLEIDQWEQDYEDPASEERVRDDAMLAAELKLPAEPAIVVSGPGGQRQLIESPSIDRDRGRGRRGFLGGGLAALGRLAVGVAEGARDPAGDEQQRDQRPPPRPRGAGRWARAPRAVLPR